MEPDPGFRIVKPLLTIELTLRGLLLFLCFARTGVQKRSIPMQKAETIIKGYEQQQVKLRGQASALKARKMGAASPRIKADAAAAIRRIERQISDLGKAIAKCRERASGAR
jgi:hypothetical protein